VNFKALILSTALASLAPWVAMAATDLSSGAAVTPAGYTDAEVKKIDPEQGKITLKHGPIENLGMPSMTMVFRADPEILANVKVGDSVRFKADKVDGAIKLTQLLSR